MSVLEFDAIYWDGIHIDEAIRFMAPLDQLPNDSEMAIPGVGYVPALGHLDVPTPDGLQLAEPGDWLVKISDGRYYPCKPAPFEFR